jgi:predicted alpha/beta-hydrolase family hydrolase
MGGGESLRFEVDGAGGVSAILLEPANALWLLVLAHGAGAGMSHPFLAALAEQLAAAGIATFRYQFPYMEQRRRAPDAPAVLMNTVAAAVRAAAKEAPELALLAGGKSMGGRMTSSAAAQGLLEGVRGLVFFGFPLHPPNRPGTKRADHLKDAGLPMLFLQGTRDSFADLKLLRRVVESLGSRATLHVMDTADHSFHVLKRARRSDDDVLRELAETTAAWAQRI